MSYVVRKDLEAGTKWDELDRKVQVRLNLDSKRVLPFLKELCLDIEAETWFRIINCGRAAMKALQSHYDGPDESKRIKEEVRSKLKNVYYKHEGAFTFQKIVANLYDAFQVLVGNPHLEYTLPEITML